jgi:hypothetical protein
MQRSVYDIVVLTLSALVMLAMFPILLWKTLQFGRSPFLRVFRRDSVRIELRLIKDKLPEAERDAVSEALEGIADITVEEFQTDDEKRHRVEGVLKTIRERSATRQLK